MLSLALIFRRKSVFCKIFRKEICQFCSVSHCAGNVTFKTSREIRCKMNALPFPCLGSGSCKAGIQDQNSNLNVVKACFSEGDRGRLKGMSWCRSQMWNFLSTKAC